MRHPSVACRPLATARAGERSRSQPYSTRRRAFDESSLENLVQHANEPARLQVVFHEPLAEVADTQLSDFGREDNIVLVDVDGPNHTREDHNLVIAVDFDLADTFDDHVAVGQHI